MMEWPKCGKCSTGVLVPLSDYGAGGAPVMYKAWVCNSCHDSMRIDKGVISFKLDKPERIDSEQHDERRIERRRY